MQGGLPPYFYSWIQGPPGNGIGLEPDFTITISNSPDQSVCYATDNWTWSWIDNFQSQSATGQTITPSLITPGAHQFAVSAYNEHGCYNEITNPITIEPLPVPMMTASNSKGCQGDL